MMTDEKEKTQEIQETSEGESKETPTETLFDKTEKVVAAQKLENDRAEALMQRKEDLFARQQLSGRADAGQVVVKKEETNEEYAKRFESGNVDLMK